MTQIDGRFRTITVPETFSEFVETKFPELKPVTAEETDKKIEVFLHSEITAQLHIYATHSGKNYLFLNHHIYN